jgi:hypothetical protein
LCADDQSVALYKNQVTGGPVRVTFIFTSEGVEGFETYALAIKTTGTTGAPPPISNVGRIIPNLWIVFLMCFALIKIVWL